MAEQVGREIPSNPAPDRNGALDGLRGIAVLLVVGLHLSAIGPDGPLGWMRRAFRSGFLGVDIFFVLSGYLITDLLLRAQLRRHHAPFAAFWRARALRLLPALVVMLAAFVGWSAVVGFPGAAGPEPVMRSVVSALTFTSNWMSTTDINALRPEIGHLWSLAVEEQFYLVWPLVIAVGLRRTRPSWIVVPVLLTAITAIGVWRAVLFGRIGWLQPYVRTDTKIDGLLVGALVAWVTTRGVRWSARAVRTAGWVGATVLIGVLVVVRDAAQPWLYRGGFTIVAVATAAIVVCITQGPWSSARLLTFRPLRTVGLVSYGLYLWHQPIIFAVERAGVRWAPNLQMLVAVGVTAVAVTVSWFAIERPAMRLRHRLEASRVTNGESKVDAPLRGRRVIAAGVGVGTLLALAAFVTGRLRPSTRPGAVLPDAHALQGLAWLHLRSRPPAGQLLADAVTVGGSGHVDLGHRLPAVAQLPVLALDADLHRWSTAWSIALAAIAVVVAALLVARAVTRLPRLAGSRWLTTWPARGVAAVAVAVGLASVTTSSAQVLDQRLWVVAAVLIAATAAVRLADGRERSRTATVLPLLGAAVVCALAARWTGLLAIGALGVVVVVGVLRRRPAVVVGALLAAVVPTAAVAASPRAETVVVASAGIGWAPPDTAAPDGLFVVAECRQLWWGSARDDRWRSADLPALDTAVQFGRRPTRGGTAGLVRFSGAVPATVSLETREDGSSRYRLDHDAVSTVTSWALVRPESAEHVVVDDPGDGLLHLRARGEPLGTIPSVDPATGATSVPSFVFDDASAAAGAPVSLVSGFGVPRPLCDAARDAALRTAVASTTTPDAATAGDLVVVGDCDAMYTRAGNGHRPWRPVEVRSLSLTVTLPNGAPAPGTSVLVQDDLDGLVGVRLESDGDRIRYRVGAPYVEAVGPWRTADTGVAHSLDVDLDPVGDQFRFTVDGELIGTVPASLAEGDGGPVIELRFAPTTDTVPGVLLAPRPTPRTPLCDQALALSDRA